MPTTTTMRAGEQPALFGATEAVETGVKGEPRAPVSRARLGSSATTRAGGHETKQGPMQGTKFHAVSLLSNLPLHEVCAYCGREIQPPGFVILDFEELGAFCNEICGDRRFRLFLEETPD